MKQINVTTNKSMIGNTLGIKSVLANHGTSQKGRERGASLAPLFAQWAPILVGERVREDFGQEIRDRRRNLTWNLITWFY